MNESPINILIKSIKHIQAKQSSYFFSQYNKIYQYFLRKFFKVSSVSICFRIVLKKEILNKLNENENFYFRENLKSSLLSYIQDKNSYLDLENKILDISNLEMFLNSLFFKFSDLKTLSLDNILAVELLLVKRKSGTNDKYSGNIAFPGGKYEKEDKDDKTTAVRETLEEIGLDLMQDGDLPCCYLGKNIRFDVTIDFKYFVNSHLFLIFDFFSESEKYFKLSENELSDIFFVPLEYFVENNQVKIINQKIFGSQCRISKLILNNNENFLLYGLTLRKIQHILNFEKDDILKFEEKIEFFGKNSFIKNQFFKLFSLFYRYTTNPVKSYNFVIFSMIILTLYYGFNHAIRNHKF
jgi:8-oxo-dGTP pyrophosphatase MutT (NUDIX family)